MLKGREREKTFYSFYHEQHQSTKLHILGRFFFKYEFFQNLF